jgi:hypothetical protein
MTKVGGVGIPQWSSAQAQYQAGSKGGTHIVQISREWALCGRLINVAMGCGCELWSVKLFVMRLISSLVNGVHAAAESRQPQILIA